MADDGTHATGEQMWHDVMGFDAPNVEGDGFMELTVDHVFGKIWTRPGLSRRERRLVSLTAAATVGQTGPLAIHLGAAVRSGDVSVDDLHEWVVQLAHYAGWPAGATAWTALREVQSQQQ